VTAQKCGRPSLAGLPLGERQLQGPHFAKVRQRQQLPVPHQEDVVGLEVAVRLETGTLSTDKTPRSTDNNAPRDRLAHLAVTLQPTHRIQDLRKHKPLSRSAPKRRAS
jgi:hypothetical protein